MISLWPKAQDSWPSQFTWPNNETLTTDVAPVGDSTDATDDIGIWSLLGVGDTVTFTATYVVTQHDVDFL